MKLLKPENSEGPEFKHETLNLIWFRSWNLQNNVLFFTFIYFCNLLEQTKYSLSAFSSSSGKMLYKDIKLIFFLFSWGAHILPLLGLKNAAVVSHSVWQASWLVYGHNIYSFFCLQSLASTEFLMRQWCHVHSMARLCSQPQRIIRHMFVYFREAGPQSSYFILHWLPLMDYCDSLV